MNIVSAISNRKLAELQSALYDYDSKHKTPDGLSLLHHAQAAGQDYIDILLRNVKYLLFSR